jgi:hypothetical protein
VRYKHAKLGVVLLERDLEMVNAKLEALSSQFPFSQFSKLIADEKFLHMRYPKGMAACFGLLNNWGHILSGVCCSEARSTSNGERDVECSL